MANSGAKSFVTAGFLGRLPESMLSLSIVFLITDLYQSFALAGALTAAYTLASAFISPFGARLLDRYGQGRLVLILVGGQLAALVGFVTAANAGADEVWLFALLIVAGGLGPQIGSLVRSRWAFLLRNKPGKLPSAFALEAVVDELVFILGPPLTTYISLQVSPWAGLAVCVMAIAVGATWLVLLRGTKPDPIPKPKEGPKLRMFSPALVVVVIVLMLVGGVFGAFEVTTVSFTEGGGEEWAAGLILALYAFGSLIAGLSLGRFRPPVSSAGAVQLFAVAMGVVVIPLPFVQAIPVLAVTAFVAGLAVAPVLIATLTLVAEIVAAGRLTEALTIAMSGVAVGFAFGAWGSGVLVDIYSPSVGYVIVAGCGVGAALATGVGHWALRTSARPTLADTVDAQVARIDLTQS
ncbi:MFS transporter [Candidatus Nanopelagicales bacterium]|nr:MFS transporter [Candidatus Nanopelagicales bacterium]